MHQGPGAAPPAAVDTRLDAKILDLILRGQLRESSSISDGSGPAMLLLDHPRFSKVLRLARIHRSLGLLANVRWWEAQPASWSDSLRSRTMPQLLFDLNREHTTGFVTISEGERIKVLAFCSGACVAVNGNLEREVLAAFVQSSVGLTAAEVQELEAAAAGAKKPLEWALLENQKVSVDGLLNVLAHQAHERLLDLFTWSDGRVAFLPDGRAGQIERVSNTPLMAVLRTGVWRPRPRSVKTAELQVLLRPLVAQPEPLRLLTEPGTLSYGLTAAETTVLQAADAGRKPAELVGELAAAPGGVESMRALYLLSRLGVIGVEGPDFAQPVLPELDELSAARPLGDDDLGPAGAADRAAEAAVELPPLNAAPAPAPPRRMSGSSELKEYRLHLQLEQEGRRLLNARQYADAVGKFEQLASRQERPVAALAYQSIAVLLQGGAGARSRAAQLADKALGLDPNSALAHAAKSCVLRAEGNAAAAERHQKQALARAQHNDSWYLEVRGLLEQGGSGLRRAGSASPAALGAAAVLAVVVMVALWAGANVLGFGKTEYFYRSRDWFFVARRGALLLGGLVGLGLVSGKGPLRVFAELGFRAKPVHLLAAVAWGALAGFLSPVQRVDAGFAAVLGLTLLHVVAEEVFFRAFVTRLFMEWMADAQHAAFAGALVFGAYHLTFYSFWVETDLIPKFYWCAVIAMFAGVPYGLLYTKSNGWLAPLLCHFIVNGTMMTLSVIGGL